MQPLIFAIGDKKPKIHESAFIARNSSRLDGTPNHSVAF